MLLMLLLLKRRQCSSPYNASYATAIYNATTAAPSAYNAANANAIMQHLSIMLII